MDLQHLRTFATIADIGNLTRAADRLCLSAPAISAQLRALEAELDIRLFLRERSGMTLTDAGASLLPKAHAALDAAAAFVGVASLVKQEAIGRLSVGTLGELPGLALCGVVDRLSRQCPLFSLSLKQGMSDELVQQVRSEKLDAAFVFADTVPKDIARLPLQTVRFVVAVPPALFVGGPVLEHSYLLSARWIVTPPGCSLSRLFSELFTWLGGRPVTTLNVDSEATLGKMISEGLGVGILRSTLADTLQAAGKTTVWSGWEAERDFCLVYRKNQFPDPRLVALARISRSEWRCTLQERPAAASD